VRLSAAVSRSAVRWAGLQAAHVEQVVDELAEFGHRTRTALLAAVSHDLRSPLASAQASVGSLQSPDVHFTPAWLRAVSAAAAHLTSILLAIADRCSRQM
jgi:two-component system, OmpR family, sensor histidine kinase KdpD